MRNLYTLDELVALAEKGHFPGDTIFELSSQPAYGNDREEIEIEKVDISDLPDANSFNFGKNIIKILAKIMVKQDEIIDHLNRRG